MSNLMLWGALALGVGASTARASPPVRPLREALEVRPGAACLEREALAAQLAARLGEPNLDRELEVRLIASPSDARDVSFELRRSGAVIASRSFFPAPESCASLAAILTLAIAMALKVSLVEAPTTRERATQAPLKRAAPSSAAAFAELGFGLLPALSAGLSLRAEHALHARFALRVEALAHTAQERAFGADSSRFAVETWLAAGRIAGCLLAPLTRLWVGRACAGFGAGTLYVAGRGYPGARSHFLPWVGASVTAELSVALSARWTIDTGANLELALGERSFGVRHADGSLAASRSLPSVATTLRLGPAYHF